MEHKSLDCQELKWSTRVWIVWNSNGTHRVWIVWNELEYKSVDSPEIEMKHKESGVWSEGEGDRTTSKLIY
jgi:hypothetical protein